MKVIELGEQVVEFGRVLGFQCLRHARLQKFSELAVFFERGQKCEATSDRIISHSPPDDVLTSQENSRGALQKQGIDGSAGEMAGC